MTESARVLLVEDEEFFVTLIRDFLERNGFRLQVFTDGPQAWEHLQAVGPLYDVILLDRHLPQMDGMDLLRHIKASTELARIPVIMETGCGDDPSIREGLDEGAYYYLTKPFQGEVLLAIVNAAYQQSRDMRQMLDSVRRAERPLALLQNGSFRFRDLDEARLLANYLARAYPNPEKTILGLQELLVNAVEHGNLAITYAEKGELLRNGSWQHEVDARLNRPEYAGRQVEVHFERQAEQIRVRITDQGDGFDWAAYLDFSPQRACDVHGRGIAMARTLSFDRIEYQGKGNTVVAEVNIGR